MSQYWLFNNPPAVSQGRTPRRAPVSGVFVFHTDEAPQQSGGAVGTAGFISRRTDYGCYHVIADDTGVVMMLPPLDWETWGAASPSDTNTHAIHIAFRGQASRWGQNPQYDDAMIKHAGRAVADIMKMLYGDNAYQYVRWITRQNCIDRVPGFVEHGTIQPGDRRDPWVGRSDQSELQTKISKAVLENLIKIPVPEGVDLRMNKPVLMRNRKTGQISVFYENSPWRVDLREGDVKKFQFFGVEWKGDSDPWFWEVTAAAKVAGK